MVDVSNYCTCSNQVISVQTVLSNFSQIEQIVTNLSFVINDTSVHHTDDIMQVPVYLERSMCLLRYCSFKIRSGGQTILGGGHDISDITFGPSFL